MFASTFLNLSRTLPRFNDSDSSSTSGAIILRISHGYKVQEENDPFIQLADIATEQFSSATAPGSFMVDILPICK